MFVWKSVVLQHTVLHKKVFKVFHVNKQMYYTIRILLKALGLKYFDLNPLYTGNP